MNKIKSEKLEPITLAGLDKVKKETDAKDQKEEQNESDSDDSSANEYDIEVSNGGSKRPYKRQRTGSRTRFSSKNTFEDKDNELSSKLKNGGGTFNSLAKVEEKEEFSEMQNRSSGESDIKEDEDENSESDSESKVSTFSSSDNSTVSSSEGTLEINSRNDDMVAKYMIPEQPAVREYLEEFMRISASKRI